MPTLCDRIIAICYSSSWDEENNTNIEIFLIKIITQNILIEITKGQDS